MGRPTNKIQAEKKILSNYFRRDSFLYTSFEERTKDKTQPYCVYDFIEECSFRDMCNLLGGVCATFNKNSNNLEWNEDEIIYKDLYRLNIKTHDYYSSLFAKANILYEDYLTNNKTYSVNHMIEETVLIEILGVERIREFNNQGYSHNLDFLIKKLTKEEIEKVKKYISKKPFGTETKISPIYRKENIDFKRYIGGNIDNIVSIEIDPTKPLKELQQFLKTIHEDYNNNKISNVFDLLDVEVVKLTNIEHELFTSNRQKPLYKLLSDRLFVYDCRKFGIPWNYIVKEINDYWISKTNQTDDTHLRKKNKLMIKFLEQQEYKFFLNSYKN